MVVHPREVVPVVEPGRHGQRDVHAQQVEGVVARLVVVLRDGGLKLSLLRDLGADGQQVQVPVHDQERPRHAPHGRSGQREPPAQPLLQLPARLRLGRVVHDVLARRRVGQLPEPRRAQVDEVQDLREVLLGPQVDLEPVQKRRPLQQQVGHRVLELPPGHVLHGLVHDGHALKHGVVLRPAHFARGQVLVPAHQQPQQVVPVQQDVRVVRLLWVRPPQPLVRRLGRQVP